MIFLVRIGVVCLVLLGAAGSAPAAIGLDATSSNTTTSSSSITISHATGNGADRLMLVGVSMTDGTGTRQVNSVTYGGANLAFVGGRRDSGNTVRCEIWRLTSPPSGTANVVVTLNGNSEGIVAGVVTFTGVDQATPLGSFTSAQGISTTPSVTLSSASGELVFDTVAFREGLSLNVGAGQTQQWSNADGSNKVRGTGSTEPGAASVTMSWSQPGGSAKEWAIGAVPIKPVPVFTVGGTVYEDVNYGGGVGRDRASSSGVVRSGARVELYNNSGNFVDNTTTDGSGNYSFPGLVAGSYTVRVVDNTVTSSRGGAGLLPVLTYRTNAGSGTAVGVTDYVGGQNPAAADAPYGAAGAVMNTTTGVFTAGIAGTAQSFAPVTISTSTVSGVDFGLNFDTIVNTNNTGRGSLRQFLTNANALGNGGLAQAGRTAGIESAIFMISNGSAAPGLRASLNYFSGGVATIAPASALPAIADPAILNAQTQPGFAGTPIVRLDGAGAGGGVDGLSLASGGTGSTVRGLMLTRFSNDGLVIQANANGVLVAGNWIGTDGGSTTLGNTNDGIEIFGANATIGGTGANDRNVIVNNVQEGINVSGASASGNVILGNYIGLEPDGTSGSGNGDVGIALLACGGSNTIGGLTAAERNVISMNFEGIEISCANNVVQGNYIGTDSTGTLNRGQRSSDAVQIVTGGTGNVIGGTAAGAGNLIAFTKSGKSGVSVQAGTGNAVLGNSIHSNTALGIDLGNNGVVTPNNGAKPAGQPNRQMDFPVFTSAALSGTTLTVAGYVGSAPNQAIFANARVEVFKSDNDPTGYGEGQAYLGFLTSDASGNISGSLTVSGLAVGDRITGTATDNTNNTSEFGANVTVAPPGYQPDAMIKLASEGAGAYATDNVYEATAATQVKSQGVVSGSIATYNIFFQNDGNVSDNVVITQAAADNCAGFTVQYQDNTSTDRTAAATGAGYTITGLAAGAGTTWTLRVTPPGTVNGGSPACRVSVTATSAGNGTKADQVRANTSSTSASLTLLKSADRANVAPGQDITYTVNASNGASLTPASAVIVTDPIPAYTGFKVGSATFSPGTSTLSLSGGAPSFSNDNGATWAYPPFSGGCAAPAGYDFCVTNVRWTTSGTMPAGTNFIVNFVVQVK